MGLYKIDSESAYVLIGCGHEAVFPLSEIRVNKDMIVFPKCPTCKARLVTVCVIRPDGTAEKYADVVARDTVIHSLHKRLQERGQYVEGAKPEEVLESMHPLAKDDEVVEAPLARKKVVG